MDQARRETERLVAETEVAFYTDPLTLYLLGLVDYYQGRYKPAIDRLELGLNSPPRRRERYRGIEIRDAFRRALSRAYSDYGASYLNHGAFEDAGRLLQRAEGYVVDRDNPARVELLQRLAVVDEVLTRFDRAVERLRECIRIKPEDKEAFLGMIVRVYISTQRLDEARRVLAEASRASRNPQIIRARCALAQQEAMRTHEEAAIRRALDLYRKEIGLARQDMRYRLVKEFGQLVRDIVHPARVQEHRPLLKELEALTLEEVERHPECPELYFILKWIYQLLGDGEKQARYEKLHDQKRKEFDRRSPKDRFDRHGRPRC
ncbi:MAG: tetratricopeptide repeat protein [Planctomycetota bacterium]